MQKGADGGRADGYSELDAMPSLCMLPCKQRVWDLLLFLVLLSGIVGVMHAYFLLASMSRYQKGCFDPLNLVACVVPLLHRGSCGDLVL